MSTKMKFAGIVTAALLSLAGCGGSGSSDTSSGSASSSAASVPSAVREASVVKLVASSDLTASMIDIVNGMAFAETQNAPGIGGTSQTDFACPDGGTIHMPSGALYGSITFDKCKNESTVLTGTVIIRENGFTFEDFRSDNNGETTYLDATITTNGEMTENHYDVTLNGTMEVAKAEATERYVFTDFRSRSEADGLRIDGSISIQNDPDRCGTNGDYTFATLDPLVVGDSGIVSGTLKINNDTVVFHADGTITVNGETISPDELETCRE